MYQWTKWEAVFSTLSVRQLRDVTIKELLEAVFSIPSMPRCFKQDKPRILSVVRNSPASKDVKADVEEVTVLEAVARRQPVKIQQTENI
jgi:hypothetical protein